MKRRRKDRIAAAFETLNSASEEELLCYKQQGTRTYEKLQRLYTALPTLPQPTDSQSSSPQPDDDHPPSPSSDNIELVRRLEQQYATIEQFTRKTAKEAVCRACSWINEDYRIVDIHVANGNPKPSNEERFIKYLAFLDLAEEYNDWEMEHYRYSTLDTWKEGCTPSKTNGHIAVFIREKRFSQARTAQTGIQRGLKLLHLDTKSGRSVITAFLALADCPLNRLHHLGIDALIQLLKRSERLWKLAENCSSWFHQCKALYKGKFYSAKGYVLSN